MLEKWNEFSPSKSLWFWSCAGCAVLTMVAGFTLGGWVTKGTASDMAADARRDGRIELAADVCVARFKNSDSFAASLAALKSESSWSRDNFLADGGWVTLTGMTEPVNGAAERCAKTLADLPEPAKASAEQPAPTKG